MSYEQRDMSGVLFKNEGDRLKQDGPLYSGSATIDGAEYFMDAWVKESKNGGKKFMSFRFKPKQQTHGQQRRAAVQRVREEEPPF